jgi:hypothetical protein
MDSVNSPFQLIVPRDIQVTFTSTVGDPLRIKFDNSKTYEVRNALLGNIDLNRERRGGALFCFDYLGDDVLKANMLTYKMNPAQEKHEGIDLSLDIVSGINKVTTDAHEQIFEKFPNLSDRTVTNIQDKAFFENKISTANLQNPDPDFTQETNEKELGCIKECSEEQNYIKRNFEGVNVESKAVIDTQDRNKQSNETKENDLRLDFGLDNPNKPHEVVKISNLVQSNLLSEKRKSQYARLAGENGCLKEKDGHPKFKSESTIAKQTQKLEGTHTFGLNQPVKSSFQKQIFPNKSVDNLAQEIGRIDFADKPISGHPINHLSRKVNINLTGNVQRNPDQILNNSQSSNQRLNSMTQTGMLFTPDGELLKEIQKNMQQKYISNVFDSKKSSFFGEKGSTIGNDSRGPLTTERNPASKDTTTERKLMHSDRVFPSSSKQKNEDSPDKTYLLKNLKLLEKEISLLQSKTAINHQEEEYLCHVYDRLSDVQNRLSLLEPANDDQDSVNQNTYSKGIQDNLFHGIPAAYDPQFLVPDDSEPRRNSPRPRENSGPVMPSNSYNLQKDESPENSHGQYNFFSKKTSKASKVSFPGSMNVKGNSFKSHKSSIGIGSDFYEKQMNKSRLREARLEAKRQARTESEFKNCTFAPYLKRKKLATEA